MLNSEIRWVRKNMQWRKGILAHHSYVRAGVSSKGELDEGAEVNDGDHIDVDEGLDICAQADVGLDDGTDFQEDINVDVDMDPDGEANFDDGLQQEVDLGNDNRIDVNLDLNKVQDVSLHAQVEHHKEVDDDFGEDGNDSLESDGDSALNDNDGIDRDDSSLDEDDDLEPGFDYEGGVDREDTRDVHVDLDINEQFVHDDLDIGIKLDEDLKETITFATATADKIDGRHC